MKVRPFLRDTGFTPVVLIFASLWMLGVCTLAAFNALGYRTPTACVFKRVTGYPCATCGSTRAVVKLARFDLAGAVALNPLMTALLIALPVWIGLLLVRKRSRTNAQSPRLSIRSRWIVVALIVLFANWAYVICQDV